MTKRAQILAYLKRYGMIDCWIAATRFRAMRLADDIMHLERQGQIKCKHHWVKPGRYMQYRVVRTSTDSRKRA